MTAREGERLRPKSPDRNREASGQAPEPLEPGGSSHSPDSAHRCPHPEPVGLTTPSCGRPAFTGKNKERTSSADVSAGKCRTGWRRPGLLSRGDGRSTDTRTQRPWRTLQHQGLPVHRVNTSGGAAGGQHTDPQPSSYGGGTEYCPGGLEPGRGAGMTLWSLPARGHCCQPVGAGWCPQRQPGKELP